MATKFVLEKGKWVIEKDPHARLDYIWPWGDWLATINDTLQSAVVSTFQGVTPETPVSHTTTDVVVWVSGGTVSKTQWGSVTVRITTVGGRVDERTAYFKIVER